MLLNIIKHNINFVNHKLILQKSSLQILDEIVYFARIQNGVKWTPSPSVDSGWIIQIEAELVVEGCAGHVNSTTINQTWNIFDNFKVSKNEWFYENGQ